MTFGFLRHHLGLKADREELKTYFIIPIVDNNNLGEAKTKLNNLIQESDTLKNTFSDDETIILDNMSLHHAQEHLDKYEETGQIKQKEATERALDEM